nr:hypothetical protein [Pandoravirus aubagnensis]
MTGARWCSPTDASGSGDLSVLGCRCRCWSVSAALTVVARRSVVIIVFLRDRARSFFFLLALSKIVRWFLWTVFSSLVAAVGSARQPLVDLGCCALSFFFYIPFPLASLFPLCQMDQSTTKRKRKKAGTFVGTRVFELPKTYAPNQRNQKNACQWRARGTGQGGSTYPAASLFPFFFALENTYIHKQTFGPRIQFFLACRTDSRARIIVSLSLPLFERHTHIHIQTLIIENPNKWQRQQCLH